MWWNIDRQAPQPEPRIAERVVQRSHEQLDDGAESLVNATIALYDRATSSSRMASTAGGSAHETFDDSVDDALIPRLLDRARVMPIAFHSRHASGRRQRGFPIVTPLSPM